MTTIFTFGYESQNFYSDPSEMRKVENPIPFLTQWRGPILYLHSQNISIKVYRSRIFKKRTGYKSNGNTDYINK